METRKLFMVFALVALFAAGLGFAATSASSTASGSSSSSSAAILQISDYSTVPTTIYPGTAGYVKVTVQNTGTDAASAVTVYYTYSAATGQLSFTSGDISAGSSSQISIPFKVPADASGIYMINVNVYYASQTNPAGSKLASMSIPMQISQYQALEVTNAPESIMSVAPGGTLPLTLVVKNKGGVVNNLVISAPDNSSFRLEGTTAKSVGSIESNSSQTVDLRITAASTASVGEYTIPLTFTYQDSLGGSTSDTLYVGPISVLEPSTQYKLAVQPLTATEVGSQAVFAISIENTGTEPLSAIVDMNSTTAFTPLGVTRLYFDPIPAGATLTKNVTIGISNSVTAGYYSLPIGITLSSGKSTTQTVGIPVTATPTITVTSDYSSGKAVIQISNTGNVAIRSVYAKAENGDYTVIGTADKFIGTLNVDDFATFTVSVNPSRNMNMNSTGKLPVTITFKDSNNQEHTVKQNLELSASAGSAAAAGAAGISGTAFRRPTGVLFGLDWIQLGIIAAVLLVVGYFGYRKFGRKKQHKPEGTKQ